PFLYTLRKCGGLIVEGKGITFLDPTWNAFYRIRNRCGDFPSIKCETTSIEFKIQIPVTEIENDMDFRIERNLLRQLKSHLAVIKTDCLNFCGNGSIKRRLRELASKE